MSLNTITDVPGILVGHAEDRRIASGVTALLFEEPAVASIAVAGGGPGLRDAALLEPGMTVEKIDALVLSGGSAFGLDSVGGVQAFLRERGRGFRLAGAVVPIVPGAILFDLVNGGLKDWGVHPVYWHLGYEAAAAATRRVDLGSVGAGLGATVATLKGGLGSASARTSGGFTVGALVAVNALGSTTLGDGPHFWAAPYEVGDEFGGLGWPDPLPADALAIDTKSAEPGHTTIAIVATDATLTKVQAKRLASMAQAGLARAIRPVFSGLDGDTVFGAATAARPAPDLANEIEIATLAADCLTRAVARAIYHAEALPFEGARPSWRERFA